MVADAGRAPWHCFDATAETALISMTDTELTDEDVLARARADLSEPVRTQTLEALRKSPLPSGVR